MKENKTSSKKCCLDKYFKSNQPDTDICGCGVTEGLFFGLNFVCCFASPGENDFVDFEPAKAQEIENNSNIMFTLPFPINSFCI